MTDKLIEDVAKAMHRNLEREFGVSWNDEVGSRKDVFRSSAKAAIAATGVVEMREALIRIRGWREIDRNTLRERLTAIEEICDTVLSNTHEPEKEDGLLIGDPDTNKVFDG